MEVSDIMTTIRQRKGLKVTEVAEDHLSQKKNVKSDGRVPSGGKLWKRFSLIVGGIVAVSLGLLTSVYVATLHENDLWFSNIKEVEREISFRTECGLYYSYYKQMLQAPSIRQGLHDLVHDNKTESLRTINILERMNVYQEVFLSILYKILPVQRYLEPVYFYIYTLFGLQALYVIALYITSWLLSGTWLSGLLAAFWYIINRIDTTRVEFTIPLRENWALPFFAVQIAAITYLLRPHLQPLHERLTLLVVFLSTFLFSLTWQFNQFMMLIQALVLFILDSLDMLPTAKVMMLYIIQVTALLLVCILQFFNSMILGSLAISFNVSVLLARTIQRNLKTGGLLNRLGKLFLHVLLVLCLTLLVNNFIKKILNLESDEHIFKFLKAKFGFGSTRDFDANLYLCEEAFGLLPLNTFSRLSDTFLFYVYIFVLFPIMITAAVVAFQNLSGSANVQPIDKMEKCTVALKPGAAYNLIHTVLFGCLALSTMRMKYLWTSHMCVFASFGLCSTEVWGFILKSVHLDTPQRICVIKYLVPIATLLYLSHKFWPGMMDELSELREFYDPDTVELMNWIKSNTPETAAFAGSMQLLAGVKLCTGRILTNHPHYEDKSLRERTKQVYQIYAKRSPEEVYRTLRSFGTDYVILEDSICYERRHSRGCRLRDLLDIANGHIMDGVGDNEPNLKPSAYPRFCEEIKKNLPAYTLYFTQVFQNKTFHVYKLTKHK
ncbi:PREDICTED: probable C-mannosyltransferase DPY19L3 [Crocodylus porosus]|uniref:probable C-mannosyltransferase DPY19L3 n=1 Tax=Crocodylus porosus TaxID=8502 RepID=UPI0009394DE0|nr:PREDICTED: probable C-mannosyltransferase DPY19L3 [Crocodylus porosus]XP_019391366.1 PREDICTED: probable C-mannosyltransferase DPY19L3 [Crocodylus porosus]XP_019391367.1 PREDICTED: probable C-mannosyltransferase DPY19L3 [Crocodylus porosus]